MKLLLPMVAEKNASAMLLTMSTGTCGGAYTSNYLYNPPGFEMAWPRGGSRRPCTSRDALQIWAGGTIKEEIVGPGFNASGLHPSFYWHTQRHIIIAVHVDGFLCTGESRKLRWSFGALQKEYDVKNHILGPASQEEVSYLNRGFTRGALGSNGNVILST